MIMKLVHAQTVLREEDLEALKKRSGCNTTKDALYTAVIHYLNCPIAGRENEEEKAFELKIKEKIEEKKRVKTLFDFEK